MGLENLFTMNPVNVFSVDPSASTMEASSILKPTGPGQLKIERVQCPQLAQALT